MLSLLTRQAAAAVRVLILLTLVLGVAYPLAVWGVSRIPGLHHRAEGSVLTVDGRPAGSSLIGIDPVPADPAADPFFHTRPSATAEDPLGIGPADPSVSGGSNKGGFSETLLGAVEQRRALIAAREGVDAARVPADAVTASASGLDPNISPAYAALQVPRVARVTGLSEADVARLVAQHTDGRPLGFLGEPGVNVPELNLAVHAAASMMRP
ncbi:potassium-transporting ATPase subunit C [Pseudonocardia asaccharolytica]|uniref:Potassium-transporting ATPase KdpC subunit n=1 Tax=Pseudonocardia asaccharolytica DSM 44247 = NBRC 16224 TaxID=1123024 RepID=A0A511D1D7_9PSEU|nr:potassium-transporting ATPase subunit C [Pseudonocardia asaccharolytica]GEL16698.1 potassium-transporting ATPase KdpC subunit [Pseudonocardia asaccharolytica DSM 44247 = NBRC 16224]